MSKQKRVAVIGAGVCGLCAIKCIKEEDMIPVCFEQTNYFAGTWRYHDDDVNGLASVMWTTVANNSKEMSALSDFVPPKESPNYLSHWLLYRMIEQYAAKNDVVRYIQFNHQVIHVEQAKDYERTGKWMVTVKNLTKDKVFREIFDGMMVCSGQFTYPNVPSYPGMERFKGDILHSKQLKKVGKFANQRVAVVGVGCSGVDAAVEISNVCKEMYLSTRSGAWILPRLGPYGLPFDCCYIRRWSDYLFRKFPYWFGCWYLESIIERLKFNHSLYGLKPQHRVMGQDPVLSDLLPPKLATGAVVLRGNIKTFTENGVIFEGETKVTELDTVVMATGYQWKFPFLADGIVTKDGDMLNLYKCVFPYHLKHPTLAIIGFFLPLGPGFPLGEAQCRWSAFLMNGKGKLPSKEVMFADIKKQFELNSKRFRVTDRITTRVNYIEYLDDITSKFGAKPNFLKMAFTDPKLFYALWFGPSLPYQYRLQGPHSWPEAREAILTFKERMVAPFKKNRQASTKSRNFKVPIKLILSLIVFWFWITISAES